MLVNCIISDELYKSIAEGSWIQGGSRTTSGTTPTTGAPGNGNTPAVQGPPIVGPSGGTTGNTEGLAGGRQNLAQSPNMAMGQAGQSTSPNSQGPLPSASHQVSSNVPLSRTYSYITFYLATLSICVPTLIRY